MKVSSDKDIVVLSSYAWSKNIASCLVIFEKRSIVKHKELSISTLQTNVIYLLLTFELHSAMPLERLDSCSALKNNSCWGFEYHWKMLDIESVSVEYKTSGQSPVLSFLP